MAFHHGPFLFCLTFALLTVLVTAYPNTVKPYARGHIFSFSSRAPLTHVLNADPTVRILTKRVLSFFQHIEHFLQTTIHLNKTSHISLTTNNSHPQQHDPHLYPTCNSRDHAWTAGSSNYIMHRGWPIPGFPSCVTNVFSIPQLSASTWTVAQLCNLLSAHSAAVTDNLSPLRLETETTTTQSETTKAWPQSKTFPIRSQTCRLQNRAAFRIDGKWHLAVGFTLHERQDGVGGGNRTSVTEFVRVAGNGRLDVARMTLPIHPGDGRSGQDEVVAHDATTVMTRWPMAGQSQNYFYGGSSADNMAVGEAVRTGEKMVEEVLEGVQGWGLVELIVPLGMNFVPSVAFGEVGMGGKVLYAVVTDVLTAMPVLLKGFEVVGVGGKRVRAVVTRMGDVSGGRETTVAGELWVADCVAGGKVREKGWLLVGVGVGMMVVGIGIEVVAGKMCWSKVRARWRRGWITAIMWVLGEVRRLEELLHSVLNVVKV